MKRTPTMTVILLAVTLLTAMLSTMVSAADGPKDRVVVMSPPGQRTISL